MIKQDKGIKLGDNIKGIYGFEGTAKISRPLVGMKIPAGFPSPAQDYIEDSLDLNEFLVPRPSSTYFVRVDGDSMIDAGVFSGDILIVDRSLEAVNNKVVIAVIDSELTVKRLKIDNDRYFLVPDNKDYPAVEVEEWMNMTIWGVATYVIHKL